MSERSECTVAQPGAADDSFGLRDVGACALVAFFLALPTGWLDVLAAWLVGAIR